MTQVASSPARNFPDHQHVAANRRQKIKVQALVQNLSPKKIHEDSEAAEEDRQPQIEKLEHPGENDGIVGQIVGLADVDAGDFPVFEVDRQMCSRRRNSGSSHAEP